MADTLRFLPAALIAPSFVTGTAMAQNAPPQGSPPGGLGAHPLRRLRFSIAKHK